VVPDGGSRREGIFKNRANLADRASEEVLCLFIKGFHESAAGRQAAQHRGADLTNPTEGVLAVVWGWVHRMLRGEGEFTRRPTTAFVWSDILRCRTCLRLISQEVL